MKTNYHNYTDQGWNISENKEVARYLIEVYNVYINYIDRLYVMFKQSELY